MTAGPVRGVEPPLLHPWRVPIFGATARLGPVVALREHRDPHGYPLHVVTATVRHRASQKDIVAAGGSLSLRKATLSALGEAFERMSIARPQTTLRACRRAELRGPSLDPRCLVHYRPEIYVSDRFEWRPYDPERPIRWVEGMRLHDRASLWVPAFAVFGDSGDAASPDGVLSTGAAAGPNARAAEIGGLLEVIERDSFMIHWENRWPGRFVSGTPGARPMLDAAAKSNLRVELRELHTDVPGARVVIALIIDHSGRRSSFSLGAAARFTLDEAASRALEEALLTLFWMTSQSASSGAGERAALEDSMQGPAHPELHARLYAGHGYASRADFLLEESGAAAPEMDREPGDDPFESMVRALAAAGREVIAVDVTAPEAQRNGLTIKRVLVPGSVPLARGVIARPLANERLHSVPLGAGRQSLAPGYNSDPHPFP